MRSFFLLVLLCAFTATVTAIKVKYWDMNGKAKCNGDNANCRNPCIQYAKTNKAKLYRYECRKCANWFYYYCQCFMEGEISNDIFLDRQSASGNCVR
jgi:hypothetical protein